MNIAFYLDEMNFRGVANSTYLYALNNKKILKNKSIIFYNKKNYRNKLEVIKKFKKKFTLISVSNFNEIDLYEKKLNLDYIYVQKGGEKDNWYSEKIKTIIHCMYPQKLSQLHGYNYSYISEWLSRKFSNSKISFIPYIVETFKTKKNLKKELKISKSNLVFGCHGGESSFDLKFVQDALKNVLKKRDDITFIFLNINKFCNHPRIKFLNGTANEKYKRKFINTCDAMIYARSLGESFGLSCGEFAIHNKLILSYKFNRHRSHQFNTLKEEFIEYGSYGELVDILLNFEIKKSKKNFVHKYKSYNSRFVMKKFKKIFNNKNNRKILISDYIYNFVSFIKMYYLYFRHKFYNHYYNLIGVKFIKVKKD